MSNGMESKKAGGEQNQNHMPNGLLTSTASKCQKKGSRKTSKPRVTTSKLKGIKKISGLHCKKCSLNFKKWDEYDNHTKRHALEIDLLRIPLKPLTKKQLKKWTRNCKLKPKKRYLSISSNGDGKLVFSRVKKETTATELTSSEEIEKLPNKDLSSVKENTVSPVDKAASDEVTSKLNEKKPESITGLHSQDLEHFCDELVSAFNSEDTEITEANEHSNLLANQELNDCTQSELNKSAASKKLKNSDSDFVSNLNSDEILSAKTSDVRLSPKVNTIIVRSVTVPPALSAVGEQNGVAHSPVKEKLLADEISSVNETSETFSEKKNDQLVSNCEHVNDGSCVKEDPKSQVPVADSGLKTDISKVNDKVTAEVHTKPTENVVSAAPGEPVKKISVGVANNKHLTDHSKSMINNNQLSHVLADKNEVRDSVIVSGTEKNPFTVIVSNKNDNTPTDVIASTSLPRLSTQESDDSRMEKVKEELRKVIASTTSHRCDVCHRTFKNTQALGSHLKTHEQPTSYSCTLCGRTFRLNSTLSRHLDVHRRILYCDKCKQFFHSNEELDIHIKEHHNGTELQLPQETKTVTTAPTMNVQVSTAPLNVNRIVPQSLLSSTHGMRNQSGVVQTNTTSTLKTSPITSATASRATDDDDVILIASQPPGSVIRVGNQTAPGSLPVIQSVCSAGLSLTGNGLRQPTLNQPPRQQIRAPQQSATTSALRFPANSSACRMVQPMLHQQQQPQQRMLYRSQQMSALLPRQQQPLMFQQSHPSIGMPNQIPVQQIQHFRNQQFQPRQKHPNPQQHPHLANLLASTSQAVRPPHVQQQSQNIITGPVQTANTTIHENMPHPKPVPTPLLRNKELTIMPLNAQPAQKGGLTITPVTGPSNGNSFNTIGKTSNTMQHQSTKDSIVSIVPVSAPREVQIIPVGQQTQNQQQARNAAEFITPVTTYSLPNQHIAHPNRLPHQQQQRMPLSLPALIPIPPNRQHITIQERGNVLHPSQNQARPLFSAQHQSPISANPIKQMVNNNAATILSRHPLYPSRPPQSMLTPTSNINQMINRHAFPPNTRTNLMQPNTTHLQTGQPLKMVSSKQPTSTTSQSNENLFAGRYVPQSTYTNDDRMRQVQMQQHRQQLQLQQQQQQQHLHHQQQQQQQQQHHQQQQHQQQQQQHHQQQQQQQQQQHHQQQQQQHSQQHPQQQQQQHHQQQQQQHSQQQQHQQQQLQLQLQQQLQQQQQHISNGNNRFVNANLASRMHAPTRYPASNMLARFPAANVTVPYFQGNSPTGMKANIPEQSTTQMTLSSNQIQVSKSQIGASQQGYMSGSRMQPSTFGMGSSMKMHLSSALPPPPPYQPPFRQANSQANNVRLPPPLVRGHNFEKSPIVSEAASTETQLIGVIDISKSSEIETVNPDIEALTCGICSSVFSDAEQLTRHLVTHGGDGDRGDGSQSPDVIFCSMEGNFDFSSACVKKETNELINMETCEASTGYVNENSNINADVDNDLSKNHGADENSNADEIATSDKIVTADETSTVDESATANESATADESATANESSAADKSATANESVTTDETETANESATTDETETADEMENTYLVSEPIKVSSDETAAAVAKETDDLDTGVEEVEDDKDTGVEEVEDELQAATTVQNSKIKDGHVFVESSTEIDPATGDPEAGETTIVITECTSLALEADETDHLVAVEEIEVAYGQDDANAEAELKDETKLSENLQAIPVDEIAANSGNNGTVQQIVENTGTDLDITEEYGSDMIAVRSDANAEWVDTTWNETSDFVCPVCDQPSSDLDSFREHLLQHQMMSEFHCTLCNVEFTDIETARRHAMLHSRKRKHSANVDAAQASKRRCLQARNFFTTCNLCKQSFGNFKLYRSHRSRCERLAAEQQFLAIPIIDLRSVSTNIDALADLGVSGFIPLTDLSNKSDNSDSSTTSYASSYGIPLLDTSSLHSDKIQQLNRLGIVQNLRLNKMMKLDESLPVYNEPQEDVFQDDSSTADVLMEIVDTIVMELEEMETLPEEVTTDNELLQNVEVTVSSS